MSYDLAVMPKERLSQNLFEDSYNDINLGDGGTSTDENIILKDMMFVDSQEQEEDNSAGSVFDLSDEDIEKYVNGLGYTAQKEDDIIADLKKLVEENKKEQQEKVLKLLDPKTITMPENLPKDQLLDIINTQQELKGGDVTAANVEDFVADVFADLNDAKRAIIKDEISNKIDL